MFVFTKRYFESRLANDLIVDSTKVKEIRTWLLRRKLHFQAIVRIWFKELVKSRNDKKLAFMYLAYDVIWHSIKDCPQFVTEFGMYMEKVFKHMVTVDFDEKEINNIGEFIKIWRKRRIFDEEIQGAVEKIWKEGSVDDITVVKEIKKDKGCVDELPPHLTCSVCAGLLKEPVQLPCCKTALCKLCAFAKLGEHNACWFGFCPKSVVMRKDEVNLSPELAIQVDLWKTRNKERIKENSVVTDLEAQKNVNEKSSCESACTDTTREKTDPRDSKILSAVASENLLKSHNNPYIVNDSASDYPSRINNNEDITLNRKRNGNACYLLKWINPTGENEQPTVPGKDSPMRDAMKRRLQCDDEGTKSKMMKQNVNDNHDEAGMLRMFDASNIKEKTLVNTEGTANIAKHSCNDHWLCERNSNADCLLKWIKTTGENERSTAVPGMKRRLHCEEEGTNPKMCKQNVIDNREALGILKISDGANVKENKHPAVVVKPEPVKILAPDVGSNGSATPRPTTGCFGCELCGITTSSNVDLKKHLQGAKHKKKLSAGCFRCQLCGIDSSSIVDLNKHLHGAKHKKKLNQEEEKWRHGGVQNSVIKL